MEALYRGGARWAGALQAGPPPLEGLWLGLTALADPARVFSGLFPLAYGLERRVGRAVLWLGCLAEWLNVLAKWFLFGERPFWWVYESGLHSKENVLLRQFPVSCETGPGSPSGHCMITGAALWPIVSALMALASRHSSSRLVKFAPFMVYVLLLLAVGLSRIFILAHFPHQVLGGIVAGAALGWVLAARVPEERELSFYIATSLALLLSAAGLYGGMRALGTDMDWSIHLATKWCLNPAWIRVETRPFASLCRDTALALGLGLATHSSLYTQLRHEPAGWKQRAAGASLGLATLQALSAVAQPENMVLWYSLSFLKYASFPWVVMVLVPWLVRSLPHTLARPHAQ
ncbi:glucose-6-phosphatase 3 isoform X3 [Pelodiscus sinensis]|uniref:glucose-6-phosphatase 3 isoform X3 n=1 Tax=Pelodiscus sinensis TaxID=13735 RepID=UPI003F6D4A95